MIAGPEAQYLGTIFFAIAVLHTLMVGWIKRWSQILSEVELVFGFWAIVFSVVLGFRYSFQEVLIYFEELRFTEPVFVFCVMMVASTKPVLWLAQILVTRLSGGICRLCKVPAVLIDLVVLLILGPLLGSLITESGAITVTALLLSKMIQKNDNGLNYLLLAVLFVNISVGGALTPFAAPPILMVAEKWVWGFSEVFQLFGWHSIAVVSVNAIGVVVYCRRSLFENLRSLKDVEQKREEMPLLLVLVHCLFLFMIVLSAHQPTVAVGLLLLLVGVTLASAKYQSGFKIKESLFVSFFLAGLVYFGPFQAWWLTPILDVVKDRSLFFLATGLTAVTDNAALTYLGSQVAGLSESSKYYLVAGALTGGGLTIIANAPNPAGFSILQKCFPEGLNAIKLFRAALAPTMVAILIFGFL